jgi:hypothetical protein
VKNRGRKMMILCFAGTGPEWRFDPVQSRLDVDGYVQSRLDVRGS